MQDSEEPSPAISKRTPWNKGKLTGAKPPLRLNPCMTNFLCNGSVNWVGSWAAAFLWSIVLQMEALTARARPLPSLHL
jgi:hypothetical protein